MCNTVVDDIVTVAIYIFYKISCYITWITRMQCFFFFLGFLYGFISNRKIMIKYIFSCIHQTSLKSNNKFVPVKVEILLSLWIFLVNFLM